MPIKICKHDAVFGRGRKKNHIRQGNIYRALIEEHYLEYGQIPARDQKERRNFVYEKIVQGVLKKGGRFIMREDKEKLRRLNPMKEKDLREIQKKVFRALFNEKQRRKTTGVADYGAVEVGSSDSEAGNEDNNSKRETGSAASTSTAAIHGWNADKSEIDFSRYVLVDQFPAFDFVKSDATAVSESTSADNDDANMVNGMSDNLLSAPLPSTDEDCFLRSLALNNKPVKDAIPQQQESHLPSDDEMNEEVCTMNLSDFDKQLIYECFEKDVNASGTSGGNAVQVFKENIKPDPDQIDKAKAEADITYTKATEASPSGSPERKYEAKSTVVTPLPFVASNISVVYSSGPAALAGFKQEKPSAEGIHNKTETAESPTKRAAATAVYQAEHSFIQSPRLGTPGAAVLE